MADGTEPFSGFVTEFQVHQAELRSHPNHLQVQDCRNQDHHNRQRLAFHRDHQPHLALQPRPLVQHPALLLRKAQLQLERLHRSRVKLQRRVSRHSHNQVKLQLLQDKHQMAQEALVVDVIIDGVALQVVVTWSKLRLRMCLNNSYHDRQVARMTLKISWLGKEGT